MKKALALTMLISMLLAGCGQPLHTAGKTYPTYGFLNESTSRSSKVCYDVSIGNVVWGVALFETIIGPVYFFGFSLYNPVRLKVDANDTCNTIDG